MGPKHKAPPVPRLVPHKDHYARLSFLFQGATQLGATHAVLLRNYARHVDLVSKKSVLKMTPRLKRSMCKKCQSVMIPGVTQTMEVQNLAKNGSDKSDVLVYACIPCGTTKRFPVGKNREYELFAEKEGVVYPVES